MRTRGRAGPATGAVARPAAAVVALLLGLSACTLLPGGTVAQPSLGPAATSSAAESSAAEDAVLDAIEAEPHAITTRPTEDPLVIARGDAVLDTLTLTRTLWREAPVVVVASDPRDLGAASSAAWLGAPLLVAPQDADPAVAAKVRAELLRLRTTHVVTSGSVPATALADGVEVVEAPTSAEQATRVLGTSAGETLPQVVPAGFEARSAASLTPGVAAWLAHDQPVAAPDETPAPSPNPTQSQSPSAAESPSEPVAAAGTAAAAASLTPGTSQAASASPAPSTSPVPSTSPAPSTSPVPSVTATPTVAPSAPPTSSSLPLVLPAALQSAVLLVIDDAPERVATIATARAAGVRVHVAEGGDLRDDTALLELTAAEAPESVVVVTHPGADVGALADQVRGARTGIQLPGGGQRVFAGKRYVALYGTPGSKALGVLGEQGTAETIARARRTADKYASLTSDTVVPTLEIIATIASKSKGKDRNYSRERTVAELTPLVDAAEKAGQYVILDLQPGRTSFLTQAKRYESLLSRPHVGLALDPEWRLKKKQVHLKQIGSVKAAEVNKVVDYLADLTASRGLPQKMLVLHQFSRSMIKERSKVDTSRPEVAVVIHVDGQGTQPAKSATWKSLRKGAPHGVHWGWKNFYDEDDPMLSPKKTYQVRPRPHLVTYQ